MAPGIQGLVAVDGFIARDGAYDTPNQTFKYLLYSGLEGGKKGVFPAVMLFFKRDVWDVEVSTHMTILHYGPVNNML